MLSKSNLNSMGSTRLLGLQQEEERRRGRRTPRHPERAGRRQARPQETAPRRCATDTQASRDALYNPNPANTEFIYLTGLEECVARILNQHTTTPVMPIPLPAPLCQTDSHPTWKWDKAAKGAEDRVICEQCVTSNVKSSQAGAHQPAKAAFAKALRQEQELEAKIRRVPEGASSNSVVPSSTWKGRVRPRGHGFQIRSPSVSRPAPSTHSRHSSTTGPIAPGHIQV